MKTLVTGGTGFIGSHVVRDLLREGREVRVLMFPDEDTVNLDGLDVERVYGDTTDAESVRKAVRGCETVFHLAAIYAIWHRQPERIREVNIGGTRNVLAEAAHAGVRRVVHTSSLAVFCGQGLDRDATEESPFEIGKSGDVYSRTKYESHQVALDFARKGLDVVIAAPCVPIGPGDRGPTPTGSFLLNLICYPVWPIVNTCSNVVDVRDVARGHLLAAEKGRTGESYLLGHANLTFSELARQASEAIGIRRPMFPVPSPLLLPGAYVVKFWSDRVSGRPPITTPAVAKIMAKGLRADCSKAVRELGLPQSPIPDAVRDAMVWFAGHGYVRNKKLTEKLLEIR